MDRKDVDVAWEILAKLTDKVKNGSGLSYDLSIRVLRMTDALRLVLTGNPLGTIEEEKSLYSAGYYKGRDDQLNIIQSAVCEILLEEDENKDLWREDSYHERA